MPSCIEKINMEAMKLILANFNALYDNGLIKQKDNDYNPVADKNYIFKLYYQYYNRHNEDGEGTFIYKPAKYHQEGRIYTDISLQNICRKVRHTISNGLLIDLDLKNCHPTLCRDFLRMNSLPCDLLDEYVENREEVLKVLGKETGMSRELCKERILAIINGQSIKAEDHQWFVEFQKEIKHATNRIGVFLPDLYKIAKQVSKDNVAHRTLNYELCRRERQKLNQLIQYCKKEKLKIGAYCHDGLMLWFDETQNYQAHCSRMTELVGIQVVIKPFDECLDLSQYQKKEIDIEEILVDTDMSDTSSETTDMSLDTMEHIPLYIDVKKEFEKTHFKLEFPYQYVEEYYDPNMKMTKLNHHSHNDFKNCYMNRMVKVWNEKKNEYEKMPFSIVWMNDYSIRVYHHITFDPSFINEDRPHSNIYNTFFGMNVDTNIIGDADKGKTGLSLFLSHLYLLSGCSKKPYRYLLKWLAWTRQKPETKTGTALVFKSIEGAGKGTFGDYWREVIIGVMYSALIDNFSDILGEGFNDLKENKLFLQFDESEQKQLNGKTSKLKSLITNKIIPVKKKFKDTNGTARDYSNIVFFSNDTVPVIISMTDRRYMVFECDDRYAAKSVKTTKEEKRSYFNNLYKYLDPKNPCPHTAKAIAKYFDEYDITGFNPEKDRILTEAYSNIQSLNIPNELKFLYDITIEWGGRRIKTEKPEDIIFYVAGMELYSEYKKWMETFNPQGKPLGKTTLEGKWKEYSFIQQKMYNNKKHFLWNYQETLNYFKEMGFERTKEEDNMSETDHRLLCEKQHY